jgi:hypothetical protein
MIAQLIAVIMQFILSVSTALVIYPSVRSAAVGSMVFTIAYLYMYFIRISKPKEKKND